MKVLGIAASPRRRGNSEILLDSALEGARSIGGKTEKIILNLFNIKPCQGCGRCSKRAVCWIKDDMQKLLGKIEGCDGLIIASPVYFGSVTAQLKIMIDRCQPLWIQKYRLKKKITKVRRATYILVSSHNKMSFFRNSKEIISILYKVLGAKLISGLCIPCVEKKGDARNNPLSRKKAFKLGQALVKGFFLTPRAKI